MRKRKILYGFLIAISLLLTACASGHEAAEQSAPTAGPVLESGKRFTTGIVLSELMADNESSLMAADGSFPDWIELYNPSSEPMPLRDLSLSDRADGDGFPLPDLTLQPGERLVVLADGGERGGREIHADFKISEGESVRLLGPEGEVLDQLDAISGEADCSVCREGETLRVCAYPTPGYENSAAGFAAFQSARSCTSALQIYEVKVAEYGPEYDSRNKKNDWVILKNVSEGEILLSEYFVSDDGRTPQKYRLPELRLPAGGTITLQCADGDAYGKTPHTGFALDAQRESLYLSDADGIVDYVSLHDIPYAGSYGRLDGENGFFYFSRPRSASNAAFEAGRTISAMPEALTRDGVFEGVDTMTVELEGEGRLYYTTDGSLPDASSAPYTGPITVSQSTVLRVVAVQENALPSPALTLSYLLNEHLTLPVVSIAGDDPHRLVSLVNKGSKSQEIPGNLTLYENGERAFSLDCGFGLSGKSSIYEFPKKNIKVNFRGAYGEKQLCWDLFGTGTDSYDSLILRAGQDAAFRLFNGEIWQDLCLDMSDSVLTQHSKYCVVYVNGEYYGIYCMKENISPGLYAQWLGVDKSSVESASHRDYRPDSYMEMYHFIIRSDMSSAENYERACELLDMDSFIDWTIVEGVSGNLDLFRNVRYFRSTEGDGKYRMALFDLDAAMKNGFASWECIFGDASHLGYSNSALTSVLESLLKNDEFRQAFLKRYGEVYDTALSNEKILERIDHYERLLLPEIARDRERWQYPLWQWSSDVDALRQTIVEKNWQRYCVERLSVYIHITQEEMERYF